MDTREYVGDSHLIVFIHFKLYKYNMINNNIPQIPDRLITDVNNIKHTSVKLSIPDYDQKKYRDNDVLRTTFTLTTKVKS